MNNEEEKFLVLTPDEGKEGKEGYIEALEWAIEQESVKNIAITGTYGSGKSSLVRTYIKDKALENVLEVSVATFNSTTNENEDEEHTNAGVVDTEGKASIENRLEQHILQQMFYTVKAEDIPNSRFSRLQVGNKKGAWCRFVDNFFNALAIVVLIIAIKYSAARQLVNIYKDNSFIDKDYFWLVIVVMILLVAFVSWRSIKIIQYFKEIGLNKLNIGTASIELNSDENVSIFNKYIDEIIYLFTNTNYELVVFEDLDRFENLEIFERLRSMNTLLNNNKDIKEKGRKVVFIYALKDDIFSINDLPEESQARTKFFDFIIPTVKVLSWSNTEEKFLEYLGNKSQHNINRELITGVSLFINDMRTLKNICNEFKIIKQALKNPALLDSKIFAMSIYKNLYPKDYTNLLNGKGIVYELFESKFSMIEQLTSQLNNEKANIEQILNSMNNEFLFEVEAIHFLFSKRIPTNGSIVIEEIGNERVTLDLTDSTRFKEFLNKVELMSENYSATEEIKIKYRKRTYNSGWIPHTEGVGDFFTVGGTQKDLYIAYKQQKIVSENKQKEIEERFETLNRNINQIKAQSIKSLFPKLRDNELIDFHGAKLISYLISEGWIAEDYTQYITYFYEGVWTLQDQEFLQAVFIGDVKEFDYLLTNVQKVLEKIPGDKISSKSIYNQDLFELIFNGNIFELNEELSAKKGVLIDYLNRNLNETITFLTKVIEKDEDNQLVGSVMKSLTEDLTSLWTEIQNVAITRNTKVEFLRYILSVFSEDQLIAISSESDLKDFISESQDILTWNNIINSIDGWELKFKAIGVKIKAFNENTDISSDISSKILRNGIYDVNLEVLKRLLKIDTIKYNRLVDNSDIATYVSANLKQYVEVLIAQNQYEENQESMIVLLNEDIDLELKQELLKVWSAKLETISEIENEDVKLEVINYDKLRITLENVLILPKQIERVEVWRALNEKVFKNTTYLSELIQTMHTFLDVYEEQRLNFTEQFYKKSKYSYEDLQRISPLLMTVEYKSDMDKNMLGNFVRCKLIEPFSSEALNDLHTYSDSEVERDIFISYLIEGIELILAGDIELNNLLNLDEAYLLIEKVEKNCLEETMAYLLTNEIEINKDLINKYMERMNGESKPEVLRQILNSMVDTVDISMKNKLEILVRNKELLYQLESLEDIKLNELVKEDSKQVVEEVITDSNISREFKDKILDNFIESHTNNISNKILRFILKKEVTISYENLLLLAQQYEDDSNVSKILYKAFSGYEINQEDLVYMSVLKTDHKILAQKDYRLALQNTNYNKKIIEILEQSQLVFNSKVEGNQLVFDTLDNSEIIQE